MAFPAGCERNAAASSNPSASNQFKMLWWAACVVLDPNHVSNNSTASWVQWREHMTKLLAAKRKKQGKKKQTTGQSIGVCASNKWVHSFTKYVDCSRQVESRSDHTA